MLSVFQVSTVRGVFFCFCLDPFLQARAVADESPARRHRRRRPALALLLAAVSVMLLTSAPMTVGGVTLSLRSADFSVISERMCDAQIC